VQTQLKHLSWLSQFQIGQNLPGYFSDLQKRLKKFVDSGQLGIFATDIGGILL
jgi:Ni,Fe-hydrogenase I large subunit